MTYTCPEIASLVEEACEEFRSLLTGRALDTNGFDRAMARIHATEASERLKLLDKDQLLIDNIDIFKRAVRRFFRQGQITFPEAQLLIAVATLFGNVESILWELKGEEGPVPPPTPRPEEPEPPRPNPDGPPIIPPDDGSPVIGEDGNQDAGNWDNGDAIEQEGDGEDDGDVGWDCHCQGSRLLVLMGPMELKTESAGGAIVRDDITHAPLASDAAMYAARKWALGFYQAQRAANAHIHMLRYDTPHSGAPNDTSRPKQPTRQASPQESVAVSPGKLVTFPARDYSWRRPDERIRSLDHTLPDCCCFFTEVMLVCHGHQGADFSFITDTLAKVLAGRPVEKFVFWSCRSSRLFSPSDANHFYQKLAWVFRPKACPCGCDSAKCKAFDPDCKRRHCPTGDKPTTILTSGAVNGVPVPVGLDINSITNPFATPDGRVRVITIQPDGSGPADQQVTAGLSPDGQQVEIFGGAKTGTDPSLTPSDAQAANPTGEQAYARNTLKPSGVETPANPYKGYSGPTVNLCDCEPEQGCLLGDACNGPGE